MAAWIAEATGEPSSLLRLAALAQAVRVPSGPMVDALVEAHGDLVDSGLSGTPAAVLSCWAALLCASVIAPGSGVIELAEWLSTIVSVEGSDELTEAVVRFARRGVTLAGAALTTVGDLADLRAQRDRGV